MRFGEREITNDTLCAPKNPVKIRDFNVDNIVISKLVKAKANSKYLVGCSDNDVRVSVLIMSKMSGHVKTFKVKQIDEDKDNIFMTFRTDDEKLLEKHKTIWTKTMKN